MTAGQKLNFNKSMNNFAEQKIGDASQIAGRPLPAVVVAQSGNMITVSVSINSDFTIPELTVPIFGPEYVRYPMQPGDKGMLLNMGIYIGGMSGQGGGVANLNIPQNLSALVYLPISNTEWASVDPDVVTVYGPEGVTLRDAESNTTFLLTPESITIAAPQSFKVTVGGTILNLTPTGWRLEGINGALTDGGGTTSPAVMQQAWLALQSWANSHVHTNGNGGGNTGQATTQLTAEIVNP
ncbi:puncturing protein [Pantoea phage PdC23]|uniref:Puncturing protein n=1 Tax=Pantoea phage PdC23 TaxID=2894356 RepID=A0AAE8YIW1_9CAUD|nr:puncturing protein [Pantoea phage PdC23]UGC97732.1 puncturing protein [Pantoea phage PdC23]